MSGLGERRLGKLTFYIVDVFAEKKYSGNQLAVIRVRNPLSDSDMQRIAREINFSETTFILSETLRNGGYDVRIFTPGEEVPFAGHPTLGSAHVIRNEITAMQSVPSPLAGEGWVRGQPQQPLRAVGLQLRRRHVVLLGAGGGTPAAFTGAAMIFLLLFIFLPKLIRLAMAADTDAIIALFGKNEQVRKVFWAVFAALAGLVLAQVADPEAAQVILRVIMEGV